MPLKGEAAARKILHTSPAQAALRTHKGPPAREADPRKYQAHSSIKSVSEAL